MKLGSNGPHSSTIFFSSRWRNPFAGKKVRSARIQAKLRFGCPWRNPLGRNKVRSFKTEKKNSILIRAGKSYAPYDVQSAKADDEVRSFNTRKNCKFRCTLAKPFCAKWMRSSKTPVKLRFQYELAQLFRTKWGSIGKNQGTRVCVWKGLCVKTFVCKEPCVEMFLCVKRSACKRVCR